MFYFFFFFFFQAEDGIRDFHVTGVQTCALPICKDVVLGLSASGRTPYVVAAVAYARARGAKTACITCNHNTPLANAADIAIIAEVGPEVISGSTRMKAATAQKMITNMI